MGLGVLNILDHPLQGEAPEAAAVHEIDGAELAALGAAPAGLHRVYGHIKAVKALGDQAAIPVGPADLLHLEERAGRIVNHLLPRTPTMIREAQDLLEAFSFQLGLNQLPECGLSLATDDVVYEIGLRAFPDLLRRQGGMIPSEDRLSSCLFSYTRQSQGFLILKAHGGQAHQIIALR